MVTIVTGIRLFVMLIIQDRNIKLLQNKDNLNEMALNINFGE